MHVFTRLLTKSKQKWERKSRYANWARLFFKINFLFNLQVLFSDDFKNSFAKLRQIQCKMQVIKLLENLAEGWRSKMRFEEFSGSFELIRINKVNDFYVIWTVDITKDDRYIQVLKVWDILPLEKIERLVSRLDHIFSLYTETYVNYCKYTCTQGYVHVTWLH